MMIPVSPTILKKVLLMTNAPELSNRGLVFIGVRGASPVFPDELGFATNQNLNVLGVDYIHPRCTLLQWDLGTNKIAAFAGSTVPNLKYVKDALGRNGEGANQLLPGFYKDFRKGVHKAGTPTAHDAWRQSGTRAFRRSSDDLDYQTDDRIEFGNPCDNMHAGWCMSVNDTYYASAGCQIVVGYPACQKRSKLPATGPWAQFKKNGYELYPDQVTFPYLLVNASDIQKVTSDPGKEVSTVLRFGSIGPAVKSAQEAMQTMGYYKGSIDSDYGLKTLNAVMALQERSFGKETVDGTVGPQTATVLGIHLPTIRI